MRRTFTPLSSGALRRSAALLSSCSSSCAGMNGFTNSTYNNRAEDFIDRVGTVVDELDSPLVEDTNFGDSVLSIETKQHGTFVMNKQAPKLQLWLASPLSGPHHYDMVEDEAAEGGCRWVSERDGHDLREKLSAELSKVLETTVVVE